MNRVDNILVIVDPTASEHPAVDKAALIATKLAARVELFALETKESRSMRYAAQLARGNAGDFVANTAAILESIAQPLRARGVDVCVETATGDPLHVQLLERTRRTSADLVIKDTHHHSLAKRTFLTNTDWHLIRGCPVPLLLTKAKPWTHAPVVMAAVDPGHVNDKPAVLDDRILDWARLFAQKLGGSLHAAHAYLPAILLTEASSGMPTMMGAISPELMEAERTRNIKAMTALVEGYGIDARCLHAELGLPSDVVPKCAEMLAADLVVMGAISRSGLQKLFIGSTAERVLETLPCDVLVIKPPDFSASLPF